MNGITRLGLVALALALSAGLDAADARGERPAGSALAPYSTAKPYTAREKAVLEHLKQDIALYKRGAVIFNSSIKHLIERSYLNEKYLLEQKYRTTLEEASRSAQSRRLEAIKEYEAFIKRYPNDTVWTPDVLMRLAELYYEKSEVDYRYADKQYNKRLREIERISKLAKRDLPVPSKPTKDYGASLAYYREILQRFPSYKKRDMVIYVLGYVLRLAAQEVESSDDDNLRGKAREYHARARQAFLGLVCSNKFNPLTKPTEPPPPGGYNVNLTKPAVAAGAPSPFEGFDPYKDCASAVDLSKFEGEDLKKRRYLLSQAWFLIGEEHFDADPSVEIEADEKEMLNKRYLTYRGQDKEEIFRNRWNEMINEKKLRALKLHNYYAISAYSRVAEKFQDSKEYNSALYKRAWTYFKIDQYLKALYEFDDLLVRAKEKDLKENAVRYVALCAFYQKQSLDPYSWLLKYYQNKGWLNDKGQQKYTHVKAAFFQLAEVLWEEAQPPPEDAGAENYSGEMLEKALKIYRWILLKGGFKNDSEDAGNPDPDWKYYLSKAPIQVRVLQILGILQVNVDKRMRAKYPRRMLYQERKMAFDRFSVYRGSPHVAFANEYEKRHGTDKAVAEALMVLRENSLMAMGRDFFNLGGQYLAAYAKGEKEVGPLTQEKAELDAKVARRARGWQRAQRRLEKIDVRLAELKQAMDGYKKTYGGYFAQAAKAFRLIVAHPQYKNTLTAYKAQFYMGLATYYSERYLEAARIFKAVQESKISAKRALEALNWRISAFSEVVRGIKLPADPDPKTEKTVVRKEIPPLLREYHELLREVINKYPKSPDVVGYQYLIAAHHYRFRQFAEARPLFNALLEKHCSSRQAFYAGQHLLTILSIEKGANYLDRLEILSSRIKAKNCGANVTCKAGDPSCDEYKKLVADRIKELDKLGPMILRERAFKAFEAKQYAKAALYFRQIIKKYPKSKDIALFLYNAAYSYEKINRFRSAKRMYELIYTKYRAQAATTKIKGAKGKIIDDSILDNVVEFLAIVALKALDYEVALKYYGILATDKIFAKHDGRVAWYYRYASLLKYHGKYDLSVKFFRMYVAEVQGKVPRWKRLARNAVDPEKKKKYEEFVKDAGKFVSRADLELGKIRERQGRWQQMISAYLRYIDHAEKTLDGKRGKITSSAYYLKNADDWELARDMMELLSGVLKKQRELRARYAAIRKIEDRILDNFIRYKLPPRTASASAAAAISFDRTKSGLDAFKKVKYTYKKLRVRWRWNKNNAHKNRQALLKKGRDTVAEALTELSAKVTAATKAYEAERNKYPDDIWYIAFQAHLGKIYETAAQLVSDPKFPPLIQKWVDLFKKLFQDPFEFEEKIKKLIFGDPSVAEKARETWDTMAKGFYKAAIDHAKKRGISNEWTQNARRWLSRIDPSKPYINEPKIEPGL
ncbi:MAG: tetratricopeptide repeat protein [bacterium]